MATYRVQLNADMGFEACRRIVPYLRRLGISHLYASPILRSRSGSTHGYDVVDPTELDPELGTAAEFRALVRSLRAAGMGLILDIVPNHMALSTENRWFRDVLTFGRASPYARSFDIDWERGDGRVVLPILDEPLDRAVSAGSIRIAVQDGEPVIRYGDWSLPVHPATRENALAGSRRRRGGPAALRRLLDGQAYRLVPWRDPDRRRNYRRFFDIGDLVALRMEEADVFEALHGLPVRLVSRGDAAGLRVDHVDGLHDPSGYLRRLRAALPRGAYVVVEKILAPDEAVPERWPIDGTTGYELVDDVAGLQTDGRGEARLGRLAGTRRPFAEVAAEAKRQVLRELFESEMRSLVERLSGLAPDLQGRRLRRALEEVTVRMPVYRTYVRRGRVGRADAAVLRRALRDAAHALPGHARELALLRRALFLRTADPDAAVGFVMRWQQLTGAVTAKGVEDTALYRYPRLLSRNDVGCDPGRPPVTVREFHRRNVGRATRSAASMVTTSTHDSKRSEDVRARIAVLSEIPEAWEAAVRRWRAVNRRLARRVGGHAVPDRLEEQTFYQTVVGIWPFDGPARPREELVTRLQDHMVKAAREAKRHTAWIDPDERHEAALRRFVAGALARADFVEDLRAFVARIAPAGAVNALAQVLLKLTVPGVPDLYQGTEMWHQRLVDPDNRVPVDFGPRSDALSSLVGRSARGPGDVVGTWPDGRIKLFLIARALNVRGERRDLFSKGSYVPLAVRGPRADRVCAFARRRGSAWAVVVVPVRVADVAAADGLLGPAPWRGTRVHLPAAAPRRWDHGLAGSLVEAARGSRSLGAETLFDGFPVALLTPAG